MLAEFGLGELLWAMLVFFFWFMAIWIFITIFADIFRRRDLSGGRRPGGSSCCSSSVPRSPDLHDRAAEDDRAGQGRAREVHGGAAPTPGLLASEEIDKAAKLRDEGKITAEEYEDLKRKAMMEV